MNCLAPAKLNLFLHVTGRRADGYHLLQTVFQMVDHGDLLHFTLRDDGQVRRVNDIAGVAEDTDLCVRAARLLQATIAGRNGSGGGSGSDSIRNNSGTTGTTGTSATIGADITLDKRLPLGGGLGGGSSDAATTLLALNHLWNAGLDRTELLALGLQLGADVPFFLFGQTAFAEGIGEALTAVRLPPCWYVVIEPGVMVPTAAIFNSPHLTRNTKPVRIADFSGAPFGFGKNDLQDVAVALHAPIADAIAWLGQFGDARMTGSGACVFCPFHTSAQAEAALVATQRHIADDALAWKAWTAAALMQHPLAYLPQS
jgi:4-diphosphocytidyl-2-C-methyl-D-erythritol kinase